MLTLMQTAACGDETQLGKEDVELAAEENASLEEADEKGLIKTRYCNYALSLVHGSERKALTITGSGQRLSANGARGVAFSNAVKCTKAWWASETDKGSALAECNRVTGFNQTLTQLVGDPDGWTLEMRYYGTQGACWGAIRGVITLD